MPIAVYQYERLAQDMLALYEDAEMTMLRRVAKRLRKGIDTPGWTEQKYAEVRSVRQELEQTLTHLRNSRLPITEKSVQQAYRESGDAFKTEAERFTDFAGVTRVSPNTRKVAEILSELNRSLDAADRMILRQSNDAFADIVGRASARAATGTITVRQAVQEELDEFARRGIASFVDKAGRQWEMGNYAEMATLTALERATLDGYTDTMQEYGYDLAVISSHAGACPLCQAWEDVVVSVSGENGEYPSLADAEAEGCFHPRCLHTLYTYYEGITHTEARKAPREVEPPSTAYSTRQTQRSYERKIREYKRRMAVADSPEDERYAFAKVQQFQGRIRELLGQYNTETNYEADWLPRKYQREGGAVRLSAAAKRLKPVRLTP